MRRFFVVSVSLVVLCGPAPVLAEDECREACPCGGLSQERRDELIAGFVLLGVGQTLGAATALAVPSSSAQRLFDFTPVGGTIDAAVRDTTPFRVRAPLLFLSGVQLVGILLLTAAAFHPDERTLAVSRDGPAIRF